MPAALEPTQPDARGSVASAEDAGRGVTARRAKPADGRRMAVINVASWRHAYRGNVPAAYHEALDVTVMEDRWNGRLAAAGPGSVCIVAEVDGVVAAYASGGAYRTQQDASPGEDTTGWGELYAIYTHPDLQGRGAGGSAHDALLTALTGHGFTTAGLWVLRDNLATISWYGDRGWRPDGATSTWSGAGAPLPELRLVHRLA
jgi:ribosomal protein S18 acetylase RimI-like enzyme